MSLIPGALETFDKYVVQGAPNATALTNKNYAKLCKDCKIVDGKKLTNADIDIIFSKHKSKGQQTINQNQFVDIMKELGTKRYGPGKEDEIFKLIVGKKPLATGTTGTSASGAVNRLTDTSQYTGSHKERFDSSGKGKGIDGREERADNSGYVSGYANQETYKNS